MATTEITTGDITAALRSAGIDYAVRYPDTVNESVIVTFPSGDQVAFGPGTDEHGNTTGDGINIAWYDGDVEDGEVGSTDWLDSTDQLVASLRRFLA